MVRVPEAPNVIISSRNPQAKGGLIRSFCADSDQSAERCRLLAEPLASRNYPRETRANFGESTRSEKAGFYLEPQPFFTTPRHREPFHALHRRFELSFRPVVRKGCRRDASWNYRTLAFIERPASFARPSAGMLASSPGSILCIPPP